MNILVDHTFNRWTTIDFNWKSMESGLRPNILAAMRLLISLKSSKEVCKHASSVELSIYGPNNGARSCLPYDTYYAITSADREITSPFYHVRGEA